MAKWDFEKMINREEYNRVLAEVKRLEEENKTLKALLVLAKENEVRQDDMIDILKVGMAASVYE
tara:strand:+ start:59 stop:250 length:192 start_codon:yes stop_codon:yes gene_type:complete